jgi:hypothetical protein
LGVFAFDRVLETELMRFVVPEVDHFRTERTPGEVSVAADQVHC